MKKQYIFVEPAPGKLIRHEKTLQHIPPEGCTVQLTRLIHRHLRSGDLIERVNPPTEATTSHKHKKSEG